MSKKNKIALLTSSRADYSIYYPLLIELKKERKIQTDIIAFGSHTSTKYGKTINTILNDGFKIKHSLPSFIYRDSPKDVSVAMGKNIIAFSKIWAKENYDLIICLGDRYEMFAAINSSIPFNIPIAHISGGEVTLGAIDNIFRDGLTIASKIHFVATEQYKKRIINILGSANNVYNVGALSIDNLKSLKLYSIIEFKKLFGIDMSKESILITFHPETVSFSKNHLYIKELISALETLKGYQLIITMPNSDTMGNMIREKLTHFISKNNNAIGVESFGTIGYLSCMKHCKFMLGNTSSGFVEASYFPKHVINLGERQKGRIITPNIHSIAINKKEILNAINKIRLLKPSKKIKIYGNGNTSKAIMKILKTHL